MKNALFNIFMAITMWYGPQFVVGFIMGLIFSFMGITLESAILPLSIAGIITGVVSEIVYWTNVSRRSRA